MKKLILALGASALVYSSLPALAAGDIEAGDRKAERCASCHGSDGIGIAGAFPNLAGQKTVYLVKQMKDFRTGKRKDPIMELEAKKLSDEDIADIAAWYASLSGEVTPRAKLH